MEDNKKTDSVDDNNAFLPSPPTIGIIEEEITDSGSGFLRVVRAKAKFVYPDDSESEVVTIDRVVRKSDDAVAIVAYAKTETDIFIYLRSAVRPALVMRDFVETGVPEARDVGNLWEVPAGLVDPGERGMDGLLNAAARELHEEIGFKVEPWKFFFLGKRTFPAVGISGERVFFLAVDVSEYVKGEPTLDGSPFERYGEIVPISLTAAKQAVNDGYIYDSKTEIAINRLVQMTKSE